MKPNYLKYFFISLFVIMLDQTAKLLVHFNMDLYSEVNVLGSWFKLHYILNPGMAFGMEIGMDNGKLILTIFRLLAMLGIGYYLYILIKKRVHPGLLWSIALILGGAIGNVIDSTLFGVLLGNAPDGVSTPWFHGQVIDMLYFPLFRGYFPEWLPFWANKEFLFFRPVFNIADSSIFIGVALILIMQKRFFTEKHSETFLTDELDEIEIENISSVDNQS